METLWRNNGDTMEKHCGKAMGPQSAILYELLEISPDGLECLLIAEPDNRGCTSYKIRNQVCGGLFAKERAVPPTRIRYLKMK